MMLRRSAWVPATIEIIPGRAMEASSLCAVQGKQPRQMPRALLDGASHPYRKVSRFAYHFARGKLGGDPAFRGILQQGLLQGSRRLLDLGCGQGLLSAMLRAAARAHRSGSWPHEWPPPPGDCRIQGIELKQRDVARARHALGKDCGITQGDIRRQEFPTVDTVVILDVLHYLTFEEQRELLKRVRAALSPGGALLLRIGDAGAGLRFRYSQWLDQLILLSRGHGWVRLHCRPLADWQALLRECGFAARALPMSQGTLFANVLLASLAV
jgi:SAM-dependent methyltransferase